MAGSALLLAFPDAMRQRLLPWLLSYATGTLLGAAFLGMIPQGLKHAAPLAITGTVLAGLVGFFILEKLVIWRHCHDADCEEHGHQAGTLILLGDAFHNFVDGVVIAAAFLTSVPLGIATALAVIAHEIPQELGDFAILLHSGLSKSRAFVYNLLSSLTTLPGVIIGWFWLAETRAAIPFVLAISAASFIYIAVADLVPSLHRHTALKSSLIQVGLILAGIATIAFFRIGH
ncbi:MAG: ZIP zinc transporter [Hydrogenophilales bacterium 16-64-46]|nr:MAG: ZIP zinc transporter [Hydrogenophilales bacterium 12-64-13]OYZ04060.1 MAG: ZIP zinc transporter [Hydrogenophilales bacterium 16-64-46]OZA36703.1 MAG: ZIP zinc transporter [Hydrogenophilales bacterium 17-64-34]